MKRLAIVSLIVVLFAPACGMKKMATKVIGGISTDGMVAIESEKDVAFAREALPGLIKTLEVLRFGNPKDARILALLAKAYGTYTFGFVEDEILSTLEKDPRHAAALARADLFYARGRDYGIASLSSAGSMRKALNAPFPEFQRTVKGLGKKQVPALFWTAFNWANWLNLHRDDPAAIVDLPRIQAMLERVIELDSPYEYGAAHAMRGAMAISRPRTLGGDPELAEAEFREARGLAPNYLMNQVMYALYFARQMQDPGLFRTTLEGVVAADGAALPEQRLANQLAKQRAELLLKMEKQLF